MFLTWYYYDTLRHGIAFDQVGRNRYFDWSSVSEVWVMTSTSIYLILVWSHQTFALTLSLKP